MNNLKWHKGKLNCQRFKKGKVTHNWNILYNSELYKKAFFRELDMV